MHIKRSIKFLLHTRKKGDALDGKNLAIRMRISYAGNAIDFPTGLNVDAEYWDAKGQHVLDGFVSKTNQKTSDINRTIDEYRSFANELFARYELLEKRIPLVGEVKDLFNDMIGRSKIELPTPNENLFKVFDSFTQIMGQKNQWSKETYIKFAALKKDIQKFDSKVSFHTINDSKLQAFIQFLGNKGLKNTTIDGKLTFIRWFLRWSSQNGYYNGQSHETFKPKIKGIDASFKEIIYLDKSEINKLRTHTFQDGQKHLEQVRDVLLFCCFTGLRYSDAYKLTRDDIKDGKIKIVTQKTADGLIIELNKNSKEIIEKYRDVGLKNKKALPVISNQKMNEYLKILGQVCELNDMQRIVYFKGNRRIEETYPKWALLTTHVGRRTFVVTALQLGIPVEVVMKWTGHSNYEAMKPYIKIVDDLKEREMSKFDSL